MRTVRRRVQVTEAVEAESVLVYAAVETMVLNGRGSREEASECRSGSLK